MRHMLSTVHVTVLSESLLHGLNEVKNKKQTKQCTDGYRGIGPLGTLQNTSLL